MKTILMEDYELSLWVFNLCQHALYEKHLEKKEETELEMVKVIEYYCKSVLKKSFKKAMLNCMANYRAKIFDSAMEYWKTKQEIEIEQNRQA